MKVKVRSLYHSPKGERGIGKWIVAWTFVLGLFYNWKVLKYNFSHEEIWVADENGEFVNDNQSPIIGMTYNRILGHCFSSTTRGDANGVRFAPASDVLGKHPKRWFYIEWECEKNKFDKAMEKARNRVGRKYDFRGVSGFVNPLPYIGRAAAKLLRMDKATKWCESRMQNPDKDYCSELSNLFKFWCGVWKSIILVISPRCSAYLLAKKTGCEPQPLVGEM